MKYSEWIDWIKKRNDIGEFSTSAHFCDGPDISVSADGVGTKLLVAKELNKFDTIGIDLVAMNVNDLIAGGSIPFGFSNYIACGSIEEYLKDVMIGIEYGCKFAKCKLMGGETAVMPDMYKQFEFDLGGFAVGYSYDKLSYPMKDLMKAGDLLYGVPSSGLHSNGFTVARNLLPSTFYKEMLKPTKIYTELISYKDRTLGMAHITGGGFSNINRILPDHLYASIEYDWEIPEIFIEIRRRGNFSTEEMADEFNLGIGMVIIINEKFENFFKDLGYIKIGKLV